MKLSLSFAVRALLILTVLMAAGIASGQDNYVTKTGWADTEQQDDLGNNDSPAPDDSDLSLLTNHFFLQFSEASRYDLAPVPCTDSGPTGITRIRSPPFS